MDRFYSLDLQLETKGVVMYSVMYALYPWNSFGVSFLFSFLSKQRVNLGIEEALKESKQSNDEEQLKKTLKGEYQVVSVICILHINCICYWSTLLNLSGISTLIL